MRTSMARTCRSWLATAESNHLFSLGSGRILILWAWMVGFYFGGLAYGCLDG